MNPWPVEMSEVLAARERIREHLSPTPLRDYPALDEHVGHGIRVWLKHENHNPTCAFKVRNAVAVLTSLTVAERHAGVGAATRGNHGQGLAWAGRRLGIPVTVCVPHGNNPEKNAAMRALGATVVESGNDYDDAVVTMNRLAAERGLRLVHSTQEPGVVAGAAIITLEMLEERPDLEAVVVSIGGGSQAVGALIVARALRPELEVYGVQAAAAPTIHDSWHAGRPTPARCEPTLADGLATRSVYPLTFPALQAGLRDFVTVSETEIAEAVRVLFGLTHTLAEGAGAAGLAGLMRLRPHLAGKRVGLIVSGGNIEASALARILDGDD